MASKKEAFSMEDLGLTQDVEDSAAAPSRDAYLFMIDCQACMYDAVPVKRRKQAENEPVKTKVPMLEMLQLAIDTIKAKAVMAPTDLIGVAFYNTANENVKDFKHIYVHTPIQPITADACLSVADLLGEEGDAGQVQERLTALCGTAPQHVSTSAIFWAATDLFNDIKSKNINKTLLICTNEDDPHQGNATKQHAAQVRLNDFIENNGSVILVSEDKAQSPKFNPQLFWSRLPTLKATSNKENLAYTGLDVTTVKLMRKTLEGITHRRLASRSLASGMVLTFGEIAPTGSDAEEGATPSSVFCGVRLYSAYVKSRLARAQLLDGATNEVVRAQTRYHLNEEDEEEEEEAVSTGRAVAGTQGYYRYGAEKLPVTVEDLISFKSGSSANATSFTPSIKILYTAPRSALDMTCHLRASAFLYPDEKVYTGSTPIFIAFMRSLLTANKMAICTLQTRKQTEERRCVLYPQEEVLDEEDGHQVQAPGCRLITLPFLNDIRQGLPPPSYRPLVAPDDLHAEEKAAFTALIAPFVRAPGDTYDPEENVNIEIQAQQQFITAKALGDNVDMTVFHEKDARQTSPALYSAIFSQYYQRLAKHAANAPSVLKAHVDEPAWSLAKAEAKMKDLYPHNNVPTTLKRKSASDVAEPSKKTKESGNEVKQMIRQRWQDGQVSKCTVAHLKDFLTTVAGMQTWRLKNMKKADLVAETEQYITQKKLFQ